MTKLDQLDAVMQRQNGILRTADIRALGVSRSYFAEYVKVRGLERVAHGVYLSPDSLGDDFFIIQSRWPQAVFSHEAALYLWGLAEREPLPVTVTFFKSRRRSVAQLVGSKVTASLIVSS